MPTIPKTTDPSTAADAGPDSIGAAVPAPIPEKQRWFSLRGNGRANQFTLSLKSHARWMKNFLHGGK